MKRWTKMFRTAALILFCFFCSELSAQFDFQAVFPGQTGSELLENLQTDFKPNNILSFANGRDSLFAKVWAKNDSISCVYTGYRRYLDPAIDPTQAAFNNGSNDGINTEHSYPQSLGAGSGNARADLHHLFPVRVDVNTARASLPYAEIPDNQTTSWHYDNTITNQIPQENIGLYSEVNSEAFEVRESFKGNIARAIFYFYTIYRSEANAADPNFFDMQRIDLCNWHQLDPVDEQEWTNSLKIADYQEGKANPFVLDCTLASRLYCDNVSDACALVNTHFPKEHDKSKVYPNPVYNFLYLDIPKNEKLISIQILDATGKQFGSFTTATEGISLRSLATGFYILKLQFNARTESMSFYKL